MKVTFLKSGDKTALFALSIAPVHRFLSRFYFKPGVKDKVIKVSIFQNQYKNLEKIFENHLTEVLTQKYKSYRIGEQLRGWCFY